MKMNDGDEQALWEKLERLVLQWRGLDADSAAARMSLNFAMTETLLTLFPQPEALDALGAFWERDLDKYDPEKGSFRAFVTSRLKLRRKDLEYEDFGARRQTVEEDGERRQRRFGAVSLDAPAGEDRSGTWGDLQQDAAAGDLQADLDTEARAQELIALILTLPQRLTRQAKNPLRINYYRMFFTDSMVDALHTVGAEPYRARERDLFDAMKVPFLDFFMAGICRTAREILACDLKDYGRMVPGRPMEPPTQPLPNDVYMQYLNREEGMAIRSASTITNQRTAYYAFLKENLC